MIWSLWALRFEISETAERAFLREKQATHSTAAKLAFPAIRVAQGGF